MKQSDKLTAVVDDILQENFKNPMMPNITHANTNIKKLKGSEVCNEEEIEQEIETIDLESINDC